MLTKVDCASATADSPIALPGSSTLSVPISCIGKTKVNVKYTIGPGAVTFDDGTTSKSFVDDCDDKTNSISRSLAFKGGAGIFTVTVDIGDGGPMSGSCPISIKGT